MRCRLCLSNSDIVRSHIIPEFLYRPGYDEKGRLYEIEASSGRRAFRQKGFREQLLCRSCEALLGKHEKYFADLWYERKALPHRVATNSVTLHVDYEPFKLFLLSVLWRASISTLEPFQVVRLGPFEEEIRLMLLQGRAGPDTRFQIFACVYLLPPTATPCHGTIVPPSKVRLPDGNKGYSIVFGGVKWFFVVSRCVIQSIRSGALSSSGSITLPVRDLTEDTTFFSIFTDHLRNARRRR